MSLNPARRPSARRSRRWLYFAIGQLARRLGVPLRCGGNFCASKLPDAQAASSREVDVAGPPVRRQLRPASAGCLEGGLVMSYEKFVMDAD